MMEKLANRKALFIFIFFAGLYSVFSIGHFGGDGYQDYLTAESIVLDGNLSLMDRPGDKDDLNYMQDVGIKGEDGRIYSARSGLGTPLVLVPFYFAGDLLARLFRNIPHDYLTMLAVSFANPFFTAFGCFLVFLIAGRLGLGAKNSAAASLIYGLATMAPVYARTGFSEPAAIMFMLLSVYFMLGIPRPDGLANAVMSAGFLFFMVFCKGNFLIFLPCFLFYFLWALKDAPIAVGRKAVFFLLFSSVFSALFAPMLLLYKSIYGSIFSFGGVDAIEFGKRIAVAPHVLKGFYYYLFSTGKGFFLFNLPLVLAFLGIRPALKKNRKEAVLFLLIFAVNLLFYVKSFRRGSLFSWGPRYLLPSAAVMSVFIGYYADAFKGFLARALAVLLAAAGFFVMLPCMVVNQSKFYSFAVEKLKINEYMINFIPDLSPIKGAWWMLLSRIFELLGRKPFVFEYAPDYRLVEPVSASMSGYNYFDIWFLKAIELAPGYSVPVYAALALLALVCVLSFFMILINAPEKHEHKPADGSHCRVPLQWSGKIGK